MSIRPSALLIRPSILLIRPKVLIVKKECVKVNMEKENDVVMRNTGLYIFYNKVRFECFADKLAVMRKEKGEDSIMPTFCSLVFTFSLPRKNSIR